VPTASYPNFAGKHAGEALFTAADFIAHLRRAGVADEGDEGVSHHYLPPALRFRGPAVRGGLAGLYQAAVAALLADAEA
jgi:hypothetical protein